MKITYNWLKEYVDFPWDWPVLVERLTMSGLELEAVEDQALRYRRVVVGQVLECAPHPNADRLSVCQVDVEEAVHQIVCGAPNVAAGQCVAVALPGATLPNGMRIQQTCIRGIESTGMICAADELDLGDDHSGILVLDSQHRPGQSLAAALGLDDVVLDFEVTPNRPDSLSVWGIAREVRALTGAELKWPSCALDESGAPTAASISIDIEDPADCPRYLGRVVRHLRMGPSPEWLQRRLQAVGQRPINNVVDITNYVLMELGQPLHAFDLNKLVDRRIVVRRARSGEHLETLDGVDRRLDEEILVIADGRQPIALAGIMGGAHSEVGEATTDILLESAYFAPQRVRRGKSLLGLHTEAAMRFERGADWEMAALAIDRAAHLMAELAGGQVAPGALDRFPAPPQTRRVALRLSRANQLLSIRLSAAEARLTLERLGCRVDGDEQEFQVTPPSYRPDLEREVDLVEEVGRLYGYDRIPGRQTAALRWLTPPPPELALPRDLRRRLTGLGFDEVVTNTIVERRWLARVGAESHFELANPPTESQDVLRSTLIPSLLDVARRNFNQRAASVAIFELGKCFDLPSDDPQQCERLSLALLWSGRSSDSPWKADAREVDFFDLKGVAEALLTGTPLRFTAAEHPCLRSGYSARLDHGHILGGYLGQVKPTICSGFDIERPVYIFELSFAALLEICSGSLWNFVPLPKFPPIERDLAIVLRDEVDSQAVCAEICETAPQLIESVCLFDLYRGDQIAEGHKSLAFSIRLRSPHKTLEDCQADAVIHDVLKRLKKCFGAALR